MSIKLENVGIAVRDLDAAVAFFTDLGLTVIGRDAVRGDWADTAVGLDGNHVKIAMLQTPDGTGLLELFEYQQPAAIESAPVVPNQIGMQRVAFSVDNLDLALDIAARHGCHPLRGVANYQGVYKLTYLRGPSDIIVMLAESLQQTNEPATQAPIEPDTPPTSEPTEIVAYSPSDYQESLALALRAWQPVFSQMRNAVPGFVYDNFYPDGWETRQESDLAHVLHHEAAHITVAKVGAAVAGWVSVRLHPEDSMGEIYVLCVDPEYQGRGIGRRLIDHAEQQVRAAGMRMIMVETGDDPGHAPARTAYETSGYERWPVARYFKEL